MLLTYADAVERLIDYMGAQPSDSVLRDAKMACIESLRDLVQSFTWTYLYRHGRINTEKGFTCGLVTYSCAGTPPFQVSLQGGTWPEWAGQGLLRINNVNYEVASRVSGTLLTLRPPQVPICDITTPSAFGLYRVTYPLPSDFAAQDMTFELQDTCWGRLTYVHPREWLMESSLWAILGNPTCYTIMADTQLAGQLALKFAPFPTESQPIDFLYKRRSNPLTVFLVNGGSLATASGSTSILGTGTQFTVSMQDTCVLRISGNSQPPTPEFGNNPAIFESKIICVHSPTSLRVYDPVPVSLTNAPYAISNYIDVEVGAMTQVFLRGCEKHISMSRILKDKPDAKEQYETALQIARSADSRYMGPRVCGDNGSYRRRLRDYPVNLGIER